jgi:hypothetical protein
MMEFKSVGRMEIPYMKWKIPPAMFETTNQIWMNHYMD